MTVVFSAPSTFSLDHSPRVGHGPANSHSLESQLVAPSAKSIVMVYVRYISQTPMRNWTRCKRGTVMPAEHACGNFEKVDQSQTDEKGHHGISP